MTDWNYQLKPNKVIAFKWDGRQCNAWDIPPWVKLEIRGSVLNEATDPPGLILETIRMGAITVQSGCWFIMNEVGFMYTRTDEAFARAFEQINPPKNGNDSLGNHHSTY